MAKPQQIPGRAGRAVDALALAHAPPPPEWLNANAAAHWEIMAAALVAAELMTVMDTPALAAHCVAYDLLATAHQAGDASAQLSAIGRTMATLMPLGISPAHRAKVRKARSSQETIQDDFGL